jgi:hypothetical protein
MAQAKTSRREETEAFVSAALNQAFEVFVDFGKFFQTTANSYTFEWWFSLYHIT